MKNDASTGQLIIGSFCIIFALIFYHLMHDSFLILLGIIGIILIITGLNENKGYMNRIIPLLIFFVFFGILIYLVFIFPFSRPEKQITIILIFVLPIVLFGVPFYTSWGKISNFKKGVKMVESGKYKEASDYFNEILKKDHNNPLAWAGKAAALQKLGKSEEAFYSIKNALDLKYKTGIKIFSLSKLIINAMIYNTAGLVYAEDGNYQKALEYYDKALESNKNFHAVWTNKGTALGEMGKLEESLKCFDKSLRYYPRSPALLNNKGETLQKLGKYSDAIKYIDKGLKIDSKLPVLWFTKGEIFMDLKRYEEALEYINKALELDPDFEDAKKAKEEILSLKVK